MKTPFNLEDGLIVGTDFIVDAFTKETTTKKLRLTSAISQSTSSTDHGFQIGVDSSENLVADTKQIQARNAGTASKILINPDGGDIEFLGINNVSIKADGEIYKLGTFRYWHQGSVGVTFNEDVSLVKNLSVSGNLSVTGTTNITGIIASPSPIMTDPIFTMGQNATDDNKDHGIEFKYNDLVAKTGFFGFQDIDKKFRYLINTTRSAADVISGSTGTIVANFEGSLSGNAVSATKWATGRTISLSGDVAGTSQLLDGSNNVSITTVVANDSHTHDTQYFKLSGGTLSGALTIASSTDEILTLKQTDIGVTAAVAEAGFNYIGFRDAQNDRQGYLGFDTVGTFVISNEIIGGKILLNKSTNISDTTDSVSTTTGAITTAGGLGVAKNLSVGGDIKANGSYYYGDNKIMFQYSDTWLRINPTTAFAAGIYCGNGILRTDGEFEVGPQGSYFRASSSALAYQGNNIFHAGTQDSVLCTNLTLTSRITFTPDTTGDVNGLTVNYMSSSATNKPVGIDHALLTMAFSPIWQAQMAADWRTNKWFTRVQTNAIWGGWAELRTSISTDRLQATGLSSAWGGVAGTSTGGLNTIMGTAGGATWIVSGSSGGVFRGGIQTLDSGGVTRYYTGSSYFQFGNDIFNVPTGIQSTTATTGAITTAGGLGVAKNLSVGGDIFVSGAITRASHNSGYLEGSYNNIAANPGKTNPIYIIGSAYRPALSTLSLMYGIGFAVGTSASYLNITDLGSAPENGWGMYVAANGKARIFLSAQTGQGCFKGNLFCQDINARGNINAVGSITAFSDIKLKTNIKVIPNAVNKVKAIRGVTFDRTDIDLHQAGVIAQEVEEVFPDVVSESSKGIKSVNYGGLVSLLIEAIKEQQTQIDELKAASK